ncbi:MAG: AAA family ATPase [Pseudomonadota bacterium]
MNAIATPQLWIIGGPNGAGKTRYALTHIRDVTGSARFINLDEIARGYSPLEPAAGQVDAARTALQRVKDFISGKTLNGNPIVTLETTLSGQTYLRLAKQAVEKGMEVHLLYFVIASPEVSRQRVAQRVREGGHDVPEVDIVRRFPRSMANVRCYIDFVSTWRVFDNSQAEPRLVAQGRTGCRAGELDEENTVPASLVADLQALPVCA